MPFMPFMPCHRQTPLSAYKFALNCHAMPVGRCEKCRKCRFRPSFCFGTMLWAKNDFQRRFKDCYSWFFSIVFLALFERPKSELSQVPPSPNGPLCLGKWPQKSRWSRLRHPAPGTWESHQVWSSVEEADSSSAPVALGLADNWRYLIT